MRIRLLPQADAKAILAEAQVSPIQNKQLITYLISRRTGEQLDSRFCSVIEPFKAMPFLETAKRLDSPKTSVTTLTVEHKTGEKDLILYNPQHAPALSAELPVSTDADCAVVRFDARGEVMRVFYAGGSYLRIGGKDFAPGVLAGVDVVGVSPEKRQVRIRLSGERAGFDPDSLVGRVVHFRNRFRRTAHPVAKAEIDDGELVLTTRDDLLAGRAKVTGIDGATLQTSTAFQFAPVYRGTYAAVDGFASFFRVRTVEEGAIHLAQPLPEGHPFEIGKDAWLVNVGPGDRFEVPGMAFWSLNAG